MKIQDLIDSGTAWKLEGAVGRAAVAAIHAGHAVLPPTRQADYFGNTIPSRHDVIPGTPGSQDYYDEHQEVCDCD